MTKHTPGPLVARCINSSARPYAVINPAGQFGDDIIAGNIERETDALLFAEAPALVEALEAKMAASTHNDRVAADKLARAVLKRVYGEQG